MQDLLEEHVHAEFQGLAPGHLGILIRRISGGLGFSMGSDTLQISRPNSHCWPGISTLLAAAKPGCTCCQAAAQPAGQACLGPHAVFCRVVRMATSNPAIQPSAGQQQEEGKKLAWSQAQPLCPKLLLTRIFPTDSSFSFFYCRCLAFCHLLIISHLSSFIDIHFNSPLYLFQCAASEHTSRLLSKPCTQAGPKLHGILVQQAGNCLAISFTYKMQTLIELHVKQSPTRCMAQSRTLACEEPSSSAALGVWE